MAQVGARCQPGPWSCPSGGDGPRGKMDGLRLVKRWRRSRRGDADRPACATLPAGELAGRAAMGEANSEGAEGLDAGEEHGALAAMAASTCWLLPGALGTGVHGAPHWRYPRLTASAGNCRFAPSPAWGAERSPSLGACLDGAGQCLGAAWWAGAPKWGAPTPWGRGYSRCLLHRPGCREQGGEVSIPLSRTTHAGRFSSPSSPGDLAAPSLPPSSSPLLPIFLR